ncbi:MAG: hypothetical protein Q4F28_00915 [Eubacteriales bacterium]|nr:hypothetical protein [Eubacteriales bacterium]
MNLKEKEKIITEIIEPIMSENGYKRDYTPDFDCQSWDYIKLNDNSGMQVISIYDDNISLNMSFFVSLPKCKEIKVAEILDNHSLKDEVQGYSYNNKKEFLSVIKMFASTLSNKGFQVIDKMAGVQNDYKQVDKRYIKLEKLAVESQYTILKEQQSYYINQICNRFLELQTDTIEKNEEELIELSYMYGQWVIWNYCGNWGWNGNRFIINNCIDQRKEDPLKIVFGSWGIKNINDLKEIWQIS